MKRRKTIAPALLVLGFVVLGLLPAVSAQAYSIIVYGRDSCGFTSAMRENLTEAKYRFTYYDVSKDDKKLEEMWDKVNKVCPLCAVQGSVKLPVMDVNNQVLIRPEFEQVKQIAGAP